MAEDSLFNDPAPDPTPIPTDGTSPGLTAEAIEALIQTQVAPIKEQLEGTQRELTASQATVQRLQDQQFTNTNPPEPAPTPDEFLEQLSSDAQGTIDKRVERGVLDQLKKLAPFLEQQSATAHQTLVQNHRAELNAKYGLGTWDSEFSRVFDARMDQLRQTDPQGLGNAGTIETEVLRLKGLKADELSDRKSNLATQVTATQEAEDQRIMEKFNFSGMVGGAHTTLPPNDKTLSETEKEYLAAAKSDGVAPENPLDHYQTLRRLTKDTDGTLESWRKAQEAPK